MSVYWYILNETMNFVLIKLPPVVENLLPNVSNLTSVAFFRECIYGQMYTHSLKETTKVRIVEMLDKKFFHHW